MGTRWGFGDELPNDLEEKVQQNQGNINTIKNDLGDLGDQVHNIQADVHKFHNLIYGKKFTTKLPINTNVPIDMSSIFIKDGNFKNGIFIVNIRLIKLDNLAFSFNMVNYVGVYSTIGCNFEFYNTRFYDKTKFQFIIRENGVMNCYTTAYDCELEVFVQQITHKGDENEI